MSGVSAPPGAPERFSPGLSGLLAQSCDTGDAGATFQPVTQDAIGILVPVPAAIVVSQIWVPIATAGITLTAGQNRAAVCDKNGVVLSTTADQSGVWISAGVTPAALPGAPITLVPPYCWVQLLASATGAVPFFHAGGVAPAVNLGPVPFGIRCQRVAVGAISLPSFNPLTSVTQRPMILVGLS